MKKEAGKKKRTRYIVGNWKMNQGLEEIDDFFEALESAGPLAEGVKAWIAPQSLHLERCLAKTRDLGLSIGAQNCFGEGEGAYTGEISPKALQELGAHFCLVGHSERRTLFGEDDALLKAKAKGALSFGLVVIFCLGETLEEREAGKTFSVLEEQIALGLEGLDSDPDQLILAYEPVWAIGSGLSATSEEIGKAHAFIRETVSKKLGAWALECPILYGGSVKPANAKDIFSVESVDGALVGGASLGPSDFRSLVSICAGEGR
ncbi:MAG: triose-phosphate isomerase [Bacteriovoracales bacterium]|nr:triose-phosphate isomerase [Bacteriovoracales bacterium]